MDKINIDNYEVSKFSIISDKWWDKDGPFKPLHLINPTRLSYILSQLKNHFTIESNHLPLQGLSILDVGCGGGILSEPLARLGGEVTAIDASAENINVASAHALEMGLEINYRNILSGALKAEEKRFDIVLALELLEHVPSPQELVLDLFALAKPGSLIIMSTINRTISSYLKAIIGAEYILGLVPKNTHDWNKFIKPSELAASVRIVGGKVVNITGMSFNPITNESSLSDNFNVNYFITVIS